ncbi:tRNA pseudouridine(38-40) synthase TruA [Pelomicrobium sp. G1]|uniref:tRNA pseudouridine(38-40) synthase TruA n=1 Tax=unclassified Pelomicrobium TaxID=2815318 RepID=UPI0021DCBCD1|nr:MAG: tRNA pseudouridine synthase A [Burkholderiales bacterium]
MRIALGLEYDGSRFCGWQSQADGCSVQDALERALGAIAGHPVRVVAAGRTDAGVHALAQVVHFDTRAARPESAWVRGTNTHLPASVAVLWARPVAEDFHARFSARERSYRYLLLNHPVRPGVASGRVGWFHQALDLERMREAARHLVGEHDFSAFRSSECQARTPVRTLSQLAIRREGSLLVFDFRANAFLHHMVRNILGCLVYVGKGAYPPEWLAQVLKGRDRALGAPTFPADGLYFSGVRYEPRWNLPAGWARDAVLPFESIPAMALEDG